MRTNDAKVSAVIEVDPTIALAPFIAAANELVTELCGSIGYSDVRLEQIETWLAAHFYAIRDPRVSSESAGGVSASYMNSVGLYLTQTPYGQQAMMLDTKGGLASVNRMPETATKKKTGVFFVGGSC
jgi:hypothetical protein